MIFIEHKDIISTVISVVLVTTTISTWSTGSFPVIAQEATSKTAYHVMNIMDAAHKFTIVYNSTLKQPHQPRWEVVVYLKAVPQVLRNIQKVNYLAPP